MTSHLPTPNFYAQPAGWHPPAPVNAAPQPAAHYTIPAQYSPQWHFQPRTLRQSKKVGAPLFLIVLGSLIIAALVYIYYSRSPIAFTIGAVPSLVALIIGLSCYMWLDQWAPAPPRLLVFAFIWGGAFATTLTLVFSIIIEGFQLVPTSDVFFSAAVQAPVIEEALKGVFLLFFLHPRLRSEMVTLVDHLVYAGFVGFGFAFVENLLYFGGAESLGETIWMAIIRTGFNLFGHSFYTSATAFGLYYGRQFGTGGRIGVGLLGYALAVGLHATWNGAATSLGVLGLLFVYLVILTPAFLLFAAAGIQGRKQEGQWIAQELPRMVDEGLLTERHAVWLGNLRNRAIMKRLLKGRSKELDHLRNLMDAVIELAVLRNRSNTDWRAYNVAEEGFLIETIRQERAATDPWIGKFLPPLLTNIPQQNFFLPWMPAGHAAPNQPAQPVMPAPSGFQPNAGLPQAAPGGAPTPVSHAGAAQFPAPATTITAPTAAGPGAQAPNQAGQAGPQYPAPASGPGQPGPAQLPQQPVTGQPAPSHIAARGLPHTPPPPAGATQQSVPAPAMPPAGQPVPPQSSAAVGGPAWTRNAPAQPGYPPDQQQPAPQQPQYPNVAAPQQPYPAPPANRPGGQPYPGTQQPNPPAQWPAPQSQSGWPYPQQR